MATKSINFQNQTGADGTIPLGNFLYETRIQFQLKSGQSVRLAKDLSELTGDPVNGTLGGIEITDQMGIVELWWLGPLFCRSDSNGAVLTYMIQGCNKLSGTVAGG